MVEKKNGLHRPHVPCPEQTPKQAPAAWTHRAGPTSTLTAFFLSSSVIFPSMHSFRLLAFSSITGSFRYCATSWAYSSVVPVRNRVTSLCTAEQILQSGTQRQADTPSKNLHQDTLLLSSSRQAQNCPRKLSEPPENPRRTPLGAHLRPRSGARQPREAREHQLAS